MKTARRLVRPASSAVLAIALLATAGSVVQADDIRSRNSSRSSRTHLVADGSLVDVQVKVEGRSAPLYFRPGTWDRHYFEAFKGQNYSLVVRNNSDRRVGVLIAVDGLNVVNGERTSLANNELMYILEAHEQADIRGWRTSLDEVRRFVFVDEQRSYAERTGQANGDMGWIRVLSFREVEPRWGQRYKGREYNYNEPRSRSEDSRGNLDSPAPQAARPEAGERSRLQAEGESMPGRDDSNPGTGWGRRQNDRVERTQFRAAAQATDHMVMRYEYRSGLQAIGIYPQRSRLWDREDGHLGFAKPPQW